MTLKTIYIVRHGYRANWLPPPHPVNPTGIDSDPPLAEHGVEQAKELATYLHSLPEDQKPQLIFSSPFYRCVETSQPISSLLSLPIYLERGIGEWYKKGRGIIPEPADYDLLKKFFPGLADSDTWARDGLGVIPDLSGETEEQIFERAKLFWQKFIPAIEAKYPHVESVILVSHAATKIALGMSLLRKDNVFDYINDEKEILKAGACSLDKYTKNGEWEIKQNGDCSFLSEGEEMNWNFHSGFEAGSDEDIKARQEEARRKKEEESKEKAENLADDEYEDFYVTVEIPMIGKNQNFEESNSSEAPRTRVNIIKPTSHFQITELNHDNPLIKISNNTYNLNSESNTNDGINNLSIIDGKIYQSSWNKLVGTDLIFDDYGELISKVTEHLTCKEHVKIIPKEPATNNDEDDEDEIETKESKDEKTNFLKRAIKYANKKNMEKKFENKHT